jgi:chemotaxis protein histidine kinase CheA
MLSKQTTGILSAIVLVAGAAAAFGITDLRFWARAEDLRQVAEDLQEVAGDTYTSQLTQLSVVLTQLRTQLDQCRAVPGANCTALIEQMAYLEAERQRLSGLKAKHGS